MISEKSGSPDFITRPELMVATDQVNQRNRNFVPEAGTARQTTPEKTRCPVTSTVNGSPNRSPDLDRQV